MVEILDKLIAKINKINTIINNNVEVQLWLNQRKFM